MKVFLYAKDSCHGWSKKVVKMVEDYYLFGQRESSNGSKIIVKIGKKYISIIYDKIVVKDGLTLLEGPQDPLFRRLLSALDC